MKKKPCARRRRFCCRGGGRQRRRGHRRRHGHRGWPPFPPPAIPRRHCHTGKPAPLPLLLLSPRLGEAAAVSRASSVVVVGAVGAAAVHAPVSAPAGTAGAPGVVGAAPPLCLRLASPPDAISAVPTVPPWTDGSAAAAGAAAAAVAGAAEEDQELKTTAFSEALWTTFGREHHLHRFHQDRSRRHHCRRNRQIHLRDNLRRRGGISHRRCPRYPDTRDSHSHRRRLSC